MRLRPIKGISDTVFLQIWCSKQRDNALKLALEEDPHSPDMFRYVLTYTSLYACYK